MVKGKANTVVNCLNFFNEVVLAGNPQIILTFHEKK